MSDEIDKAGRRNPGRFKPGQSGNPGGPPKHILTKIREAHADDPIAIVALWIRLAKGEKVEGYGDAGAKERLRAGEPAVDRLLGKSTQVLDATIRDGHVDQLVEALKLSPHERRERLAKIAAEDEYAPTEAERDATDTA